MAGVMHYANGDVPISAYDVGPSAHAQFFLMPGYTSVPALSAHLEVTVHYRVRHTIQQLDETPAATFTGLVTNHSYASAMPGGFQETVTASSHPEGDTGAFVTAANSMQNFYNPSYVDKIKSTLRTISLKSTDAAGNPLTNAYGHHYSEGTIDLKAILDIKGQSGFPQAGAGISLGFPKSVMVVRPENSGPPAADDGTTIPGYNELDAYTADGSQGMGNSRFSNGVYLSNDVGSNVIIEGYDFGDELYTSLLLGEPWPGLLDLDNRFDSRCRRDWSWNSSTGRSDSGSNMGGYLWNSAAVPPFYDTRPHVYWPWTLGNGYASYIPLDSLDEMQSSQMPQPVATTITHQITDTDQTGNHHEWDYDKTATFGITFHNRIEEPTNLKTARTPTKDNPWHKYYTPTGSIVESGYVPGASDGRGTNPWNPGNATEYLEFNFGASFNCAYSFWSAGVNGGVNHGAGYTTNVPPQDIKPGETGMVYFRIDKFRTTFDYKHYTQGGRHIVGFNPDGSEIPHSGYEDRGIGGVTFAVWVQQNGSDWPESTDFEIIPGGQ